MKVGLLTGLGFPNPPSLFVMMLLWRVDKALHCISCVNGLCLEHRFACCICDLCRSLVALSLILSLLLFSPAPLYILDEVDAALDLSHTQNIGQMLKTHFKQSQVCFQCWQLLCDF